MFRGRTPKAERAQRRGSSDGPKTFETPLQELTYCLNRMEELIDKTRTYWKDLEKNPSLLTPAPKKERTGFLARSRRRAAGAESTPESGAATKPEPSPSSTGVPPKAKLVPMIPSDEEELVEVLRRTAELVVIGEKAAAKAEKRGQQRTDELEEEEDMAQMMAHIAIFENFFERNALDTIVKLATGVALKESAKPKVKIFDERPVAVAEEDEETSAGSGEAGEDTAETSDKTSEKARDKTEETTPDQVEDTKKQEDPSEPVIDPNLVLLPPLPVATQAIQSVSILIQNVSRATSLYFLLSNNYVNDLIELPLELYSYAERNQRGEATPARMMGGSPEIAELTTHYVTFLKSLALRMNAETLQFYLTYPGERGEDMELDESTKSDVDDGTQPKSPVSKPVKVKTVEVEFPLYGRALEYCSAHQDSFVRVTAMNICMNTLRLATVSPNETDDGAVDFGNSMSSPDGSLFNAQALPLRERLSIAQHVCAPSRVESLVSPIFTKLAQIWGTIEEQLRDIDLLREGLLHARDGRTRIRDSKMERAKAEAKKSKLANSLRDTVADLQDELLILEDVFNVGLTSLNEQTIEMMLATFVYPLLLQPLILYMQRFASENVDKERANSFADVLTLGATTSPKEASALIREPDRIEEAAPAKTALFTLAAVFQIVSNQPLLRLLITALFHPLAPEATGESMIRAAPDVAGEGPDGKLVIRVDAPSTGLIKMEPSPYSFGNVTGALAVKGDDRRDGVCVYVLSPALMGVLEGEAGDLKMIAKTRSNPYRRAVLKCLGAGPGISGLRQVAVVLLDSCIGNFESKFCSDLILGAGMKTMADDTPLDERSLDSRRAYLNNNRDMGERNASTSRNSMGGKVGGNHMKDVISALCTSVINVSTNYERLWKLVFDGIAAHALLRLAKENPKAMELASKIIDQRRRLSSTFVSELPLLMESAVGPPPVSQDEEANDQDEEMRVGLHSQDMFFAAAKGKQFSVVGELLKLKDTVGPTERDEYSVSVAVASKFDDLASRASNFGKFQLDEEIKNGVLQVAATSSMALVQVDAYSNFLKDMAATGSLAVKGDAPTAFTVSRQGTLVSTKTFHGFDVNRSIFGPLSERMGNLLLRLDEEMSDKEIPEPGSIVGLVGRTAIPCVCEVHESNNSNLKIGDTSSVVADGVKWLSLYLVFLGRYMILAEPERKGSGGNGRVVSACHLTRLTVERDALPAAGNSSPARRIILVHHSPDMSAPGLFVGQMAAPSTPFGPFTRLQTAKSNLDVWFEDENAADHAFRVMTTKLSRAKAKRGNRLREKLAVDVRHASLTEGSSS